MARREVTVPDLGEFKNVEIVELLVKAGDKVRAEQPLLTLETDKAAMEVPAPAAGTVVEIKVAQGGRVSKGDLILILDAEDSAAPAPPEAAKPLVPTPAPREAAPQARSLPPINEA
ncbi:MAG: biotin/lipoyl-containing protein, partial [Gammaproteobacteria bacterium]